MTMFTSTADGPDTTRAARPIGTWALQGALTALGAYAALSAQGLGIWTEIGPGPGFFPLVLALALIGLSIAWFFQTPRSTAGLTGDEKAVYRSAAITVLSLVVLAGVVEILGFQLSMFVFLLFHLRWMGKVRWIPSVLVALAGSVGAYHLFSDFLLVPLPLASISPLIELGL